MSDVLEQILKLGQKCLEQIPVVVLGSGASAQYGVGGMGALQEHLLANVTPADPAEEAEWKKFTAELTRTNDLELALHNIKLSAPLELRVVQATRNMVLKDDLALLQSLTAGRVEFALSKLLKHLLNSTVPRVQIVTTNYDRLAEYACDAVCIPFSTGFTGGYLRSHQVGAPANGGASVVEILKVHGSVDWFMDAQQSVIGVPDSVTVPPTFVPLLVTPGTGKYLVTHEEPFRTIITRSDAAFSSARSALCVGYGFNDRHIQPKLTNRVLKEQVPVVILARTLTPKAKEFIGQCRHKSYLALEKNGTGSRAFYAEQPLGVELAEPIWEFGAFFAAVTGKS